MPNAAPIVLITRAQPGGDRFAAQLRAFDPDMAIISSPLMSIRPLPWAPLIDVMSPDADLILTSQHAVAILAMAENPITLSGRTAYCVGAATARAAASLGLIAQSADGNADDLVEMICAAAPQNPLVHLRGDYTTGDIAARLRESGFMTSDHAIYEQPAEPMTADAVSALNGTAPIVVPLFSSRSARLFAQSIANQPTLAPLIIVAMSQSVAKHCKAIAGPIDIKIAKTPEQDAVLDLVLDVSAHI